MQLNEIIEKTMALIQERGYTEKTWKCGFRNGRFSSIREYFARYGIAEFNADLARSHVVELQNRYEDGEFSYSRVCHLKKMTLWLIAVAETGHLPYKINYTSKIILTPYFYDILDRWIASVEGKYKPSHTVQMKSAGIQFMGYLQHVRNIEDFSDLTREMMHEYLIYQHQHRKGSLDNIVYHTKGMLGFLYQENITLNNLSQALILPAKKSERVLGYFTHEEVTRIMEQPDRNTMAGKRNYAIIAIGKNTGLRIGDIVNLKLENIDFANDTICLVQRKTDYPLILPLDSETKSALLDYLERDRPICQVTNVFLRCNAPYGPLSVQSVTTMFRRYVTSAGIGYAPGQGRGFHGLRRSMI